MNETVITILKLTYVKLASVAQKETCGWITPEQARELANNIFQGAAAEISRRTRENFVTDN